MKKEDEIKYCKHCGRKMHKNRTIWHLGTCNICYKKLDVYHSLRSADQSKRYRKWYSNPVNKEKELARAKTNYQKKKREKENLNAE